MREGDGWSERAHYLAGQALRTMKTMGRNSGIPYFFRDVPAHGIRGDAVNGIAALREAIDSGCRFNWWQLRTPSFDLVRDDETYGSEWRELIAELESDIAKQREWYYAHKDEALF